MKKRQDSKVKSLTVRVPGELIDRLKIRAVQLHVPVQYLVARACDEYLKRERKEAEE